MRLFFREVLPKPASRRAGARARPAGPDLGLGAAIACAALFLLTGGCQRESAPEATLALVPCRPEGFAEEVRCGALARPEDPAAPNGRQLQLQVTVLPARASHPRPDPLYVIAGGPGQSARGVAPLLGRFFSLVRKQRDVVLVDQRGTGGSNPLACADLGGELPIAARLRRDEALEAREIDGCRADLERKADLRFYGTAQAIDDLDAVRAALGHAQINLWGTSYGTRVALAYLGRHEARVRSATLDAVVPPDVRLPEAMGQGAADALQKTFDDCAARPACAAAFPDLAARFRALVERLETSPLEATAPDPRTGAPHAVSLTAEALTSTVRNLLYDPDLAALLPLTLTSLERGDARGFLAQADALTRATGDVSEGMHLCVFCGEDFARAGEAAAHGLFGRQVAASYAQACARWPRGEAPEWLFEPVRSGVPVLILSGALDPVTPPAFGERVLATLSNARHVVAPGLSHGLTARDYTAKVVAHFIDKPLPGALDVACIEATARPPFFLSFAGPEP